MLQAAGNAPGTAAAEWRAHWTMVLASLVGMSFSSMAIHSLGLFIDPLIHQFGWTHAQVTAGFSTAPLLMIPLAPLVGTLIDRWGSRRLAIPGTVMSACAFACFSLANGSVTQWVLLWVVYATLNAAVNATVWTTAVAGIFLKSRGMALAATLSGAALAQTVAPLLSQRLIDSYGWRSAFRWIGLGWGAVVLLLVVPFFFDATDRRRRAGTPALHTAVIDSAAAAANAMATGLTLQQALRTRAIVRIGLALFIAATLGVGLTVHKINILTAGGMTRATAAEIAASAGIAGISGKLLTGWLLDRWQTGWIPGISVGLPALACLSLLEPLRTTPLIVLAMLIIGYSSGAYLQVCTYLTSRHGGLRNFGKIFGVMAALMSLGSSLGPQLIAFVVDRFGTYTPVLIVGIPVALLAGWLVCNLGPYPHWEDAPR
jgi:MFS family permease